MCWKLLRELLQAPRSERTDHPGFAQAPCWLPHLTQLMSKCASTVTRYMPSP